MKHFKSILANGCVFSTVITLIASVVALIVDRAEGLFKEVSLPVSQFLVILAFSFLIAAANRILTLRRMHAALRLLIHYAALLVSFLFIFVLAGNLKITGADSIFIAVFLFTVLYAAAMAIVLSLLSALGILGKGKKNQKSSAVPYKNRF